MAQLQQLLHLAHTPGPQMTGAAQQLEVLELQQGFGQALLTLLAGEQLTAQAAAIYLKNFLQRRWQSLEDRESLRDALVPATLNADRLVRKQLCAAVEELALQDPEHWPALLPQLVSATAGMVSATAGIGASGTAQATLELAHAALKHLRSDGRHVELTRQARYSAEVLGPLHLELWRFACDRVISSEAPDLESGNQLLLAATEVLYDITRLVMPEHVHQNLEIYMQGILAILAVQRSTPHDLLQELCGILAMWLSRYPELLENEKRWPSRSVEAVWTLLIKCDHSCEHDALVISAIAVLSSVACQEWQMSPFGDAQVLAAVCEGVVLPNLKLRTVDLELFHDDLQEYIARDVEGNDIQTRRWAAIDLVRSLRRRHDKETCELVVTYVKKVLQEAVSSDPQTMAICKHACIHLVISMAGSTGGQRFTVPGGLATEFFKEQLGPELLTVQEPPRGTTVEAVLFKAACLKFITVLRNILPAELVLGIVPRFPLLLQAEHPLLHSYAAICSNVLTTVQDRVTEQGSSLWRPRYTRQQLGPVLMEMIPSLLRLLEGRSIPQNTHLVRALSAWLAFLGNELPHDLATKTLQALAQVASCLPTPGNADYVHLVFACIALSLKALGDRRSATDEAAMLAMVEKLWVSQAEDLLPYCYQIMGLMLDLGAKSMPYAELLQQLLAPQLWQAPGKVPGLVRLLRAFFAKVAVFRTLLQQAMPNIFERFQQALSNKQSASAAVGLLCAAFRFLPFELYCNHFQAALQACLSRVECIKMIELEKDLVVALSIFVHVVGDGAMVLCMALNQLKEGLFERFLMEVWLPGTYRIQLLQRRKICIFGLIRVMQLPQMPEKAFEACCQALLRLLRLRQAGHPILIFEELFNNRPLFLCKKAEGINPGEEFQVAYNHLEQAELKEDIWDVLPEIQDVACAKVAVKAALAPLQQALSKVEGVTAALEEILC